MEKAPQIGIWGVYLVCSTLSLEGLWRDLSEYVETRDGGGLRAHGAFLHALAGVRIKNRYA